ncbi:MAG: energy-coupling factor ABC transporter permease [Thiotrichaceae bacterium]|nr:energy-coupling factor ABC transporter permease [Thiotrichaceae bacterium]
MNFNSSTLPEEWLWIGFALYALILLWALWTADWQRLKDGRDANILFASCVLLWLLWLMSAGTLRGMEFHLLLATSAMLMFGWQFATLCVSVAQLCLTLTGKADWLSFPLNVLCNGIVPIWMSYAVYWATYTFLPKHFFVYVYMNGFIGGAMAMLASRLTGLGILIFSQVYQWQDLGEQPMFIIVMLFPEAFLNGMVMTVLVVFRPEWVSSFSDRHYLKGK